MTDSGTAPLTPARMVAPALLVTIGWLAVGSATRADEAENYQLLRAMPRERRVALAENLERFDKLDGAEQAAIRKLDAEIARKDPVEQARYRALLRRYHLWVNGLTDDQKKQLREAPTAEARYARARQFRVKDAQAAPSGPKFGGIRTGDFGLLRPYEAAHLLRIWNKLAAGKRAEIEKKHERGRLFAAIRAEAKAAGVRMEPFSAADEAAYIARIEEDAELRQVFGPPGKAADSSSKKPEGAQKKAEPARRWYEHPFAEFLYFEDHAPWAVAQKDLERFSAACPGWLHAITDPLSPDDARQYLTILYRLLYPHPGEMPAESKAANAPAATPTAPRPVPKKAANTGPI